VDICIVPKTQTWFGDQSFVVAGTQLWNSSIIIIISFIYSTTEQYKYSDNVDTNEVETGMTRLIALAVTPVY